jgi:hypothetical protein
VHAVEDMTRLNWRSLDGFGRFLLVWKGVLIILTLVAIIVGCLNMIDSGNSKCAGLHELGSLTNQGAGFLVQGEMSLIILLVLLMSPTWAEGLREGLANDIPIVALSGLIRTTVGAYLVYLPLVGLVVMFAVLAGTTIRQYITIGHYCR